MFPDIIEIRVTDSATGEPVCGIALMLILFADRKNDYHLLPQLTDLAGITRIDRSWIEQEIEKNLNFSIMDYSSRLIDCKRKIGINILYWEVINGINDRRKGTSYPQIIANNHMYKVYDTIVDLSANTDSIVKINLKLQRNHPDI